jgi:hypothetical protein
MKTRIFLTLALLIGLPVLNRVLVEPAEAVVKNQAAVATLNGGDAAFVAQQAVDAGFATGSTLLLLALVVSLGFIWFPVFKMAVSDTESFVK